MKTGTIEHRPRITGTEEDSNPESVLSMAMRVILLITNPTAVFRQHFDRVSAFWAFGISGLAFTLLFLQSTLDMRHAGYAGYLE